MEAVKLRNRVPRYAKSLPNGNCVPLIPSSWEELEPIKTENCDPEFLRILANHGFTEVRVTVPLQRRYTRGRPWTKEEFTACFNAWRSGVSLTLIAAALNRNPQDMIYRLLDHCHERGIKFTEAGRSAGVANWTPQVADCASRLFEAGLPAWKIAALFRVDFEHVEKQVFIHRDDYGHQKQNPFSINTAHKHFTNEQVLESTEVRIVDALDPFAGEGKTTEIIARLFSDVRILACESNNETFARAQRRIWEQRVTWVCADNLSLLQNKIESGAKYDLIDLDPFVSCHEQLKLIWPLLKSSALLFLTFGGEYRRSFIGSNRKAIASRYGFSNSELGNKDYLEVVPHFFLGWVAKLAAMHLFTFSVIRAVRYANNCRFWLRLEAGEKSEVERWSIEHIVDEAGGHRFRTLEIPRFAQIRRELDERNQLGLFK